MSAGIPAKCPTCGRPSALNTHHCPQLTDAQWATRCLSMLCTAPSCRQVYNIHTHAQPGKPS